MKTVLRNPEIYKMLILQIIITILAAVMAFWIDRQAGIIVTAACLLLLLIHLIGTVRRYRKIRSFAEDVNRILHGDNGVSLDHYAEGELGILHSEIYKMTVRLRDQQHRLLEDKIYLADSIADISHQIRTPLTSINLMVQLLSEPNQTEERRRELLHDLQDMLLRIDWLITTLLKISKLDAGTVAFKRECMGLEPLIKKACATLLIPIELRNQELSIHATGEFTGDISWTCEALGNIVKNCMEHTPEGGRIQIEADENALYSQIVISDNGKGISAEDLPHIFERFYKGKDSDEKSFGVGLALSRMIITGQKGTIKAENGHRGGAMFTIRFYKGTV